MDERKKNGSKLFLTELTIAIFFFAVVVAICIQLFANSYTTGRKSKELTEAVNLTSNFAEFYYSWNEEEESLKAVYPYAEYDGKTVIINYDEDFNETSSKGEYLLRIELVNKEKLQVADIRFFDEDNEEIYRLNVERIAHEK